jgi:hypothetical protein
MEKHEVLYTMLSTGKRYSIGVNDLGTLLLKLTVLSVKYVSRRQLWAARFGEDFVDWDMVENVARSKNVLGGCSEWLGLLGFCKWDELGKHEGEIQTGHDPLFGLRRHMRECSLDTGDACAWTLVCKVFLLMLIQGLSCMHALEVLTCGVFKRNTGAGCTMLLAKQVFFPVLFFIIFACSFSSDVRRRSTCSRPSSTRRRCTLCWTGARWTGRGWTRRRPCARPRRRTRSCA